MTRDSGELTSIYLPEGDGGHPCPQKNMNVAFEFDGLVDLGRYGRSPSFETTQTGEGVQVFEADIEHVDGTSVRAIMPYARERFYTTT